MTVIQFHQVKTGRGSTTTSALMTALALRELRDAKVLLIGDNSAAHYLGLKRDPEVKFIYNYVQTGTLSGEKLERYTSLMYRRAHFMQYCSADDKDGRVIEAVLRAASEIFDYVVIDIDARLSGSFEIIHVDTLSQCDRDVEMYFDTLREKMKSSDEKRIQMIGQYHEELSHFRLRQMRKIYHHKDIFGVPFDKGLHRASSDRSLLSYIKLAFDKESARDFGRLRTSFEEVCRALERLEVEAYKVS